MDRRRVEEAIEALDSLLAVPSTSEAQFQELFEAHPIVFHTLGFQSQIAHPVIRTAEGTTYIPDFIARRPNGSWEIVELKTASAEILRDKERREAFYASFESYLAQCHEYSEALDDASARAEFEVRYGIDLIQKRPSSIVIAGSSESLDVNRLLRLCSRRSPPIAIYTFDDIRSALLSYRTFNFSKYDSAQGITVHGILQIHRPEPASSRSYILDIGVERDRNRVSIFVDEKSFLRIEALDSNGNRHAARAQLPLGEQFFDVNRRFLFEVGVSDEFGFISIQIDGHYCADIRVQDFPFDVSHEYVIGSDWEAKEPSSFSIVEMGVLNRALSFEEKIQIRDHCANTTNRFQSGILSLNWSAFYAGHPGRIVFQGHKWMHTAKHPAGAKHPET